MKLLLSGILLSFCATNSFANFWVNDLEFSMLTEAKHKKCHGLKMGIDQQNSIQDLRVQTKKQINLLKAEIKNARIDHRLVLRDKMSTKDQAEATIKMLHDKRMEMLALKSNTKLAIQYDILSPDQRITMMKCRKKMRRHNMMRRRGHRGQGFHHGQRRHRGSRPR